MKASIKSCFWKLFFLIHEKKFIYNGHEIKYLYKDCKSDKLCIVFSAFPQKGNMPGYNYVRSLWNRGGVNLLYICDDMVKIPTGGSYYLGSNGDYWGINAVKALIEEFTKKRKYVKRVGIGSSKGGTAALMFGLELQFDAVIIGGCQYKIGSYLNCPYHYKSLQVLTGMKHVSDDAIYELDCITKKIVFSQKESQTEIWFHYSTEEHTYEEQIKDLLHDLQINNYKVHENIMNYSEHADIAKYFPTYMLSILNDLVNGKKD